LAYDLPRERIAFENDQLQYEKIKWPVYKELIFKRRQIPMIPIYARNVSRLVGLRNGVSQLQQPQVDKSITESTQKLDLKELDRIAREMTDNVNRQNETV